MSAVIEINHPLVMHKLALLRDKTCGAKDFRELVNEISMLMGYEVLRDLPTSPVEVETPVGTATCQMLTGKKIAVVPILRAGLGMVDGILQLVPTAKIGHIGMYRDHDTLQPVEYFCKLPSDIDKREIILVDPMVGTGGSAVDGIGLLKSKGAASIRLVCLVASPEGIDTIQKAHPDVDIYVGHIDEGLNDSAYVVPGMGDAGDRLFGTK